MPKGFDLDREMIIRLRGEGKGFAKIAKLLNCERDSVTQLLRRYGIRQRNRTPLSGWERKRIVEGYRSGLSAIKVAGEIGREFRWVYRYLKKAGEPIRSLSESKRKYPLDQSAFAEVESSPEASYWVGFLMADGCVGIGKRGQRTVSLSLHKRDKDHVHKFREFLKTTYPITREKSNGFGNGKRTLVKLHVTSGKLVENLMSFGVVPRKSKIAKIKKLEMSRDFWRGVVDGDGWLGFREGKYPLFGVTGSLPLMKQFRNLVQMVCGKTPSILANNSVWKVGLAGTDASKMASFLYQKGDQVLTRKEPAWAKTAKWRSARRCKISIVS